MSIGHWCFPRLNKPRTDQLRQPLRIAQAAIQLRPMFVLESEIPGATRSFAPKFADILRRRVILYGDDSFAHISVPRESRRFDSSSSNS